MAVGVSSHNTLNIAYEKGAPQEGTPFCSVLTCIDTRDLQRQAF